MKRRSFLKTSSIVSTPLIMGGISVAPVVQNTFSSLLNPDSDRVLVLIQLNGGNDGLNSVIPRDQYAALAAVRPQVLVPESSILNLTDKVGFHPSMSALKEVYDDGHLSIIQSVGYPNQNRSHFRSTDIWHTGSNAETFLNTGWLGRYFDRFYENYPADFPNDNCSDPFALTIGSSVSETCQGMAGNFSLALVDPENLSQLSTPINNEVTAGCYAGKLDFLAKTIEQTNAYGTVIQKANDLGSNVSSLYKENDSLAQKLKLVAKLIKGGLQTKIYVVSLGGFDTHADQVVDGDTTNGIHAALLRELSEAILAFQDDLKGLGIFERVAGMTYSEFGRRIRSNFSNGTDHGTAAPLILFGSCVLPTIHGDNPEISTNVGEQEGVPMQYDFRSVYGSMLADWFEIEESIIQEILMGDFQKIDLFSGCAAISTSTEEALINQLEVNIFPNPTTTNINLTFQSKGEVTKISLFDTIGYEIKVYNHQKFIPGTHTLQLDMTNLLSGTYYLRLQTKNDQKTLRLVKI